MLTKTVCVWVIEEERERDGVCKNKGKNVLEWVCILGSRYGKKYRERELWDFVNNRGRERKIAQREREILFSQRFLFSFFYFWMLCVLTPRLNCPWTCVYSIFSRRNQPILWTGEGSLYALDHFADWSSCNYSGSFFIYCGFLLVPNKSAGMWCRITTS